MTEAGGPRALLLGVGNVHRRDDGIGPFMVRALAPRLGGTQAVAVERGDDPVRLIAAWEGWTSVTVVDAALSSQPPGTLGMHEGVPKVCADMLRCASSHGIGLAGAAELSAMLGTLPPSFRVVTVSGADFGHGEGLSPALAACVPALVDRLLSLLRSDGAPQSAAGRSAALATVPGVRRA